MRRSVVILTLACVLVGTVEAQERQAPMLEVAAGALLFPDDGTVGEAFVGGAARFYVSPRVSIGPEVAFITGQNHRHLMLTGNVTYDFHGPVQGQPPPVTPFVVVGAGLFRTREEFVSASPFTSTEGSFTVGGGVRGSLGKKVVAGAEARVGWETHVRLNAFLGIRLGR
jgi:hypothetical protein